nr:AAA family ATPase [uncultured Lachnoclostridium sp.]
MLIGFAVSNYRSFYQKQTISFLASKVARHKEHVTEIGNRKILKSSLIFGANAGGKTNLIRAINFSRNIILEGLDSVNLSKKHFRIERDAYNQPGVFEYRMMVGEKEYSYGIVISYAKAEVISEWLVRIEKSGREVEIFNRIVDESGKSNVTTEIKSGSKLEKMRMEIYLEDFGENISDVFRKKSILSDIAQRGNGKEGIFEEITSVYEWFNQIIVLFPSTRYEGINELAANSHRRKFFSTKLLNYDTGICKVDSKKEEMNFDKILEGVPREEAEKIKVIVSNQTSKHPVTMRINEQIFDLRKDENGNIIYNKIVMDHGNAEEQFEYQDESDGTKRLFDLIPLLADNCNGRVILIDEIDRSLHTNLTRRFVSDFYQMANNRNVQLITTTHDSHLLDLDLLRQDEIWFVERQPDHSSRMYSLDDFKQRYDKKIDKEYLIGRYGAIPLLSPDFDMEE